MATKLGDIAPNDVLLGVRPENIQVAAEEEDDAMAVGVEIVEQMGSDLFAHFLLREHRYTARLLPAAPVAAGQPVRLTLNMDKIHLFDARTEANLTLG